MTEFLSKCYYEHCESGGGNHRKPSRETAMLGARAAARASKVTLEVEREDGDKPSWAMTTRWDTATRRLKNQKIPSDCDTHVEDSQA